MKTETKPERIVLHPPKRLGLVQQVRQLNEKLDFIAETTLKKGKKDKHFRLKRSVKSKLKNLAKKNKVLVILLKANRSIQPLIAEIKDGFIVVNEKYHQCSTDFIYLWQGKAPCIVLPEWDLTPIGTSDYYDSVDEGRKADAQQIIIRAMEAKETEHKKKISGKAMIWIAIAVIAVVYVIFTGGGG